LAKPDELRTAKPCGPGRRCYGQAFAEMCASPTGWTASSIRGAREARRKVRLPGEHGISRPTIAQGRPSDRRHLYAAVRFFCATSSRSGPRVPVGTRSSLRPLGLEGGEIEQSSGEFSRENAKACLQPHTHCHRPARPDDPVLRDSCGSTERPRRTGCTAGLSSGSPKTRPGGGNDNGIWRRSRGPKLRHCRC